MKPDTSIAGLIIFILLAAVCSMLFCFFTLLAAANAVTVVLAEFRIQSVIFALVEAALAWGFLKAARCCFATIEEYRENRLQARLEQYDVE